MYKRQDDGWSGGNFDRPAWKRLVADIEAGKVAHLLCKDLSRIGRNYLQTGFYTEVMFRQNGVHFVAVANNIDSEEQDSGEFAPFLNIKMCIRDRSMKVMVRAIIVRSPDTFHVDSMPFFTNSSWSKG